MKNLIHVISIFFTISLSIPAESGNWQTNVPIGGFNQVNIYTPSSISSIGQGRGLLIVLHGCVQPINSFNNANLESAAEEFGIVIAVPDAMNKAGFSCWSYWQGAISRNSGDYKNLINLATALISDSEKSIDANQVYIAGLSSGASFANTAACLAPDIFAGMGISAGPSIGTSSNGAIGTCESAPVQQRCLQYAGSYASHFETQIASIAHGENDTTVNLCYNRQNAEGMAALYGVDETPGTITIEEPPGRTAIQTLWQNARVSMLLFNNVDHAWSAGEGASGSYINSNSINYARYLGDYFSRNNLRVSRNQAPFLENISVVESGQGFTVNGRGVDPDGEVVEIFVTFDGLFQGDYQSTSTVPDSAGMFSLMSKEFSHDLYQIDIHALDNEGTLSENVRLLERIGPEPPPTAPQLDGVNLSVEEQCVSISGNVIDENLNLERVDLLFANGTVTAEVNGFNFFGQQCALPGGPNSVVIKAVDDTDLDSSLTLGFEINAGQTGDYNFHIARGHISWGQGYATCYLEYGVNSFTMWERPSGANCRWEDEDASCVGPEQACSNASPEPTPTTTPAPTPTPTPSPNECEEITTQNYFHKLGGRAYSEGNPLAPNYFTVGTNQAMQGSTWGITTLNSNGDNTWNVGGCP